MADQNNSEGERQRSYPASLEGVLRFAVENTNTEDRTNVEPVQPMSEERRTWLSEALASVSGLNPVTRMQNILKTLCQYLGLVPAGDQLPEIHQIYSELDELIGWCELIDMACDFHKINGFVILKPLQDSPDLELRWRAGELIATICQNNPYCQQCVLREAGLMERLMSITESLTEHETTRIKSLYALSALLRGCEEAQSKFFAHGGLSLLLTAMQSSVAKLRLKASYILIGILQDSPSKKEEITKMGCVEQLLTLLNQEHDQHHEYYMAAFLELLVGNELAQSEAVRPELHLLDFLGQRIALIQDKPEHLEEYEYARNVEQLLFESEEGMMNR